VRHASGVARAGDLFRDDDVAGSLEELNAEFDRAGARSTPTPARPPPALGGPFMMTRHGSRRLCTRRAGHFSGARRSC
jgi:hypothetical protein